MELWLPTLPAESTIFMFAGDQVAPPSVDLANLRFVLVESR